MRTKHHDELIRRMAEPDDLKALRQQHENLQDQLRQNTEKYMYEIEKNRLRQLIKEMGGIPCR